MLSKYIASFHDDGIELKIFLNEELSRLKGALTISLRDKELIKDTVLCENTKKVLSVLDNYREAEVDVGMIQQVLKIQDLVEELGS